MTRIPTHMFLAAGVLLAATPLHAQAAGPSAAASIARTPSAGPAAAANPARDSALAAAKARFVADVVAAAGAQGGAPAGLVVLAADPASGRAELKLSHATVAEAALAPALERVRGELKAFAGQAPLLWHVRLDAAPVPAGRVERPVIANPRETRALINQFVSRNFHEIFQGRRGIRVDLQLLVTREGEVAHVVLARSCGNPAVDAEALRIAPTLRFTPARVGTQPIDTQMAFPLYFVVGEA